MPNSILLTRKFRTRMARAFLDSLSSNTNHAFLFLGRPQEWDNDSLPPTPVDCPQNVDFEFWRDAIGVKNVHPANTAFIVPRRNWTSGTIYDQYDDTEDDSGLELYVLDMEESPYKVYKCLWNNDGGASTVAPSFPGASVNPVALSDGYVWQYMYTVGSENYEFLTDDWMPVLSDDDVVLNAMTFAGRLPTAVPLLIVDGGSSYNASLSTATTITGDGAGANVTSNGVSITAGAVTSVVLASGGAGYTEVSSVNVYQSGAASAEVRAIIPPYPNHGADPVKELGATTIMLNATFEADEASYVTVNNDFRRVGLLINPLVTDGSNAFSRTYRMTYDIVFSANTGVLAADDVISNISKSPSPTALVLEVVPSLSNANYIVRLTRVDTKNEDAPFEVGDVIKNLDSGVEVTIDEITEPDLQRFSGDIVFVNQRTPVTRDDDQNEEIKLVFPFD